MEITKEKLLQLKDSLEIVRMEFYGLRDSIYHRAENEEGIDWEEFNQQDFLEGQLQGYTKCLIDFFEIEGFLKLFSNITKDEQIQSKEGPTTI